MLQRLAVKVAVGVGRAVTVVGGFPPSSRVGVRLNVIARYGTDLHATAEAVRRAVRADLAAHAEVDADAIDIYIDDLHQD